MDNTNNNKWSEKGITFKIPTLDDLKIVDSFVKTYFYAEEPTIRSTGLMVGNGFIDKQIAKIFQDFMVKEGLKDGTSMIALDESGDIIGCRLGGCFDKNSKKDPKMGWMKSLPLWMVPKKFMIIACLEHFMNSPECRYGKDLAFEDVPSATKFYHGLSLTVSSKARGMGLGKELIERTNVIGKEKGCSHVYIAASSIYSQAIFKKCNFQVLHEAKYEGVKHKDGTELFKDMREHKTLQVVLFDLSTLS